MANGEISILTGGSGTQYAFTVFPRSSTFHPNGGVYVVARARDEPNYDMIFIGEAQDMSVRPLNREKLSCFNQWRADSILLWVEEESDKKRRAAVVADLLKAYAPACNAM